MNEQKQSRSNEILCAHSGLVFAALLAIGLFGIAGWLPLVKPGLNAEQIQALFEQDRIRIRIGMTVLALAAVFWWSFSSAIAMVMKRIEGDSHPLTYVQMASATGTVLGVFIPAYIWLAAAYRPEIPAGTLQAMNDLAWLMIIGAYPPAVLQAVAIAICILGDRKHTYPRWVGFASLWAAILFLPGALLPFFKIGPFAWNGLIGFWLVAVAFFAWIILMWWATVAAIKKT